MSWKLKLDKVLKKICHELVYLDEKYDKKYASKYERLNMPSSAPIMITQLGKSLCYVHILNYLFQSWFHSSIVSNNFLHSNRLLVKLYHESHYAKNSYDEIISIYFKLHKVQL